jgi:hypothetical protein
VQAAPENHILQDQETTPAAANYENSSLTSSQGMPTNIQSGHGNDVNSQGPHMNIQPGPDVNTRMNLIPTGNGNDVSNMASMFAAAVGIVKISVSDDEYEALALTLLLTARTSFTFRWEYHCARSKSHSKSIYRREVGFIYKRGYYLAQHPAKHYRG